MYTPAGQRRQDPATMPETRRAGEAAFASRRERSPRRGNGSSRQVSRGGGFVRGLTGSLAAGLLVLAVALGGVQWWASTQPINGPGIGVVLGHFVASGAALGLQAVADRRRDAVGGLSALGVFVVVLAALTYWWWI